MMLKRHLIVFLSCLIIYVDSKCKTPDYCKTCSGDGVNTICVSCNDGYYLQDGSCEQCPANCVTCTSSTRCESCETPHWNSAYMCDRECSVGCTNTGCVDTTGHCHECIQGRYGQTCEEDCSFCANGKCDRIGCREGCNDGYFQYSIHSGYTKCVTCSDYCITCTNATYCTQCENGYYGSYYRHSSGRGTMQCALCADECKSCTSVDQCVWCKAECVNQDCDGPGNCVTTTATPKTTERTTLKPVTSKPPEKTQTQSETNTTQEAPTPSSTTKSPHTDASQQKADDNSTIIGAAAGGGVFVLLVVVVVFIVCFIKRRSKKSDGSQEEGNVNTIIKAEAEQDIPIYARPMKKSKPHEELPQDNLYAQPMKKKKNHTYHTKSEIGEPQRVAYSNIVFNLDNDNTSVTMGETNVDDIQLEDVDEGRLTTDIDMGNNIPTSDTYYNMEGLVRSQVKVSQLLEYVRKKTDFETEFKKLPDGLQRSCDEALKTKNRKNNRYNGIYAYDATRVVLESKTYINANYIDGHNQARAYIASLGPTADTMNEYATFWEMVWQNKTEAIVMLTNLKEGSTQYEYLHQCVLYALTCDTEPVGGKDLYRQVTEDRITQQYKAMIALDYVIKRQPSKSNRERKENRKGSDIPDDQYRVQLVSPRGGYINAVYINGYARINQYITTQTPLPSTMTEFISMIDHEKVQCIVCLDDEHETDKTVGQYLPEDYKTSKFGKYTIKCASINMTKDFIIRELKLTEDGTPSFQDRIIRHYQYRGWKSGQHVPPDTKSFLKLLVDVNKNLDKQKSDCPILVHCLTGSVRSGIFCAVATMMEVLVLESQITGIHYISHVRDRRHSAIQNQEMFTFCYDCVKCLIDLSENDPYYNLHSLGQ